MRGSESATLTFGRENRVHHRVPYSSRVQLRLSDKVYAVTCVNLSLGGAAVQSSLPCSVGDELRVSFSSGTSPQRFTIRAQVVRVENGMLGLRFVEFEQQALLALLAEVAKSEPPPPPGDSNPPPGDSR